MYLLFIYIYGRFAILNEGRVSHKLKERKGKRNNKNIVVILTKC